MTNSLHTKEGVGETEGQEEEFKRKLETPCGTLAAAVHGMASCCLYNVGTAPLAENKQIPLT